MTAVDIFVPLICYPLIAMALHEVGHVAAALALGVRVKRVGVSWKGVFIVRESGSPAANLAVTLAGPLANLLVAAGWPVSHQFALTNLIFGLYNLAPFISCSDGQRALALMRKSQHPIG